MKKLLFMFLALMGFSACAAHAQADGEKKPPSRKVPIRKVVAFYGDSTIRGYQTHSGGQVGISTPQAFAAALSPHTRLTVLNEGADSSRVEHLLAGTDGKHPPWESYIANAKVDIVITNHASKNGNPAGQYEADMRKMISIARSHGKSVILMTPNPIAEGGLDAYADAMRRIAISDKVPLIDVLQYLNDYMAASGKTVSDLVPDGYHPADDVYVMIGRYAAREFKKITFD